MSENMGSYTFLDIGPGAIFLDHTLYAIMGDDGPFLHREKGRILFIWGLWIIEVFNQGIIEFINDKQSPLFPVFALDAQQAGSFPMIRFKAFDL